MIMYRGYDEEGFVLQDAHRCLTWAQGAGFAEEKSLTRQASRRESECRSQVSGSGIVS